eukprot:1363840-Amorphochlora_amoeboformis.AAC.1
MNHPHKLKPERFQQGKRMNEPCGVIYWVNNFVLFGFGPLRTRQMTKEDQAKAIDHPAGPHVAMVGDMINDIRSVAKS